MRRRGSLIEAGAHNDSMTLQHINRKHTTNMLPRAMSHITNPLHHRNMHTHNTCYILIQLLLLQNTQQEGQGVG